MMWCIPPEHNAAFVCAMETVLEVYQRPYDPEYPAVLLSDDRGRGHPYRAGRGVVLPRTAKRSAGNG